MSKHEKIGFTVCAIVVASVIIPLFIFLFSDVHMYDKAEKAYKSSLEYSFEELDNKFKTANVFDMGLVQGKHIIKMYVRENGYNYEFIFVDGLLYYKDRKELKR